MKTLLRLLLGLWPVLLCADPGTVGESAPSAPNRKVLGKSEEASYAGQVVVVTIGQYDLINAESYKFIRRTLKRAEDEGARAVVFSLNTPGGDAQETKNLMRAMVESKVPIYSYVNPEAGSAGALVCAATDGIYMAPNSVVGAAALVSGTGEEIEKTMRKKLESFYITYARSIAEKQGHNPDVLDAMMKVSEEDRTFGTLTLPAGELLSLSAETAVEVVDGKPLFARAIVGSVDELLAKEGLGGVPVVKADPTAFERIAWWVKFLSPLLIVIGIGAAYAEMKVPGFGIAGIISLTAFGLFFFGNFVAGNLAGYELAAVFVLGIVLVAVEIFLIPGTGVTGILGALLIVGALLAGMIDEIDYQDFSNEGFSGGEVLHLLKLPATSLSIGLVGALILVALLVRFLGALPGVKWISLGHQIAGGASLAAAGEPVESRIGWTGVTTTDLRPAGKAEFHGRVLDVVADGAFIAKGERVRISEEEGMRIEVQRA